VSRFYSTREGKPLSKNLSLDLPWSKFYLLYKEILHHGWSKQHPNYLAATTQEIKPPWFFHMLPIKEPDCKNDCFFQNYPIAQYWETPIKIPASIS
jgi:hypothetical protein